VEAIAHVASPVGVASEDPIKDVINVAINGTTSLLNSALKYGKNVKSVVVVSSLVSVLDSSVPEEYVYDEKNWNDGAMKSVIELKAKGESVHPFMAYMASKNESERAVWKFKDENTPSFTLTTVIPSWIYGAIVPTPRTAADVDAASTASYVAQFYTGESQNYNQVFTPVGFVNVADVTHATLLIVEKNDISDGQRYILNAGTYSFQEIADILRKNFPERESIIVKGEPGNYEKANQPKKHDGSKITRDLGLKYSSLETTVVDLANSIKHVY
jgi:nucleoside-diphosphate-sugar epimerase